MTGRWGRYGDGRVMGGGMRGERGRYGGGGGCEIETPL